MKAANSCVFQSYGVILLTYLRGSMTSLARGASRPLHKWPPVKSAPERCSSAPVGWVIGPVINMVSEMT